MDNGHPKGNIENPYFTAGVGNISPDVNGDLGNSIDKEDWERSLEISAPVGMPAPEQITNTEIANTEDAGLYSAENITPDSPAPKAQENQTIKTLENPYELGQITPMGAPVDPSNPALAKPQKYNPVNIRTTGDYLEKSTIPEIDNIIEELSQTGDLNNFYDEIRGTDEKPGMMETNLQNSFNRKLGQDQGKAA